MATSLDCGGHDGINSERYGFYLEGGTNTNKCSCVCRGASEWASGL